MSKPDTLEVPARSPISRTASLPVAERWFNVVPRANDIVQVSEQWIDPYLTGDMWLLRGRDRSLLVDTGTGIISPRETIDALVSGPLLALATNGWYDHAGGLYAFAERISHFEEAGIIGSPTAASSVADVFVSDDMLSALPSPEYSTANFAMRGTTVTRTVADGDVIDLGDRQLEVLHMPGDTPGHIILFEAATGTLFTGDTLFDDPEPQSRGQYKKHYAVYDGKAHRQRRANLERISALPIITVCAGHFGQINARRLEGLLARLSGPG